jgi:hypothetical protein
MGGPVRRGRTRQRDDAAAGAGQRALPTVAWPRLAAGLGILGALAGCGLDLDPILDIPPVDCEVISRSAWQVTLPLDELQVGESVEGRITPGFPPGCDEAITAVTWDVDDVSVASVTPLGARNPPSETAGSIARAWVSAVAPGSTRVTARVETSDGAVLEARPQSLSVVPAGASMGLIVASGIAEVRFNEFTGGGASDLIPVVIPRAGRLEITIDWTSFRRNLGFFFWKGSCVEVPCPGELLVDAQLGSVKPRREAVDDVEAGDYTLEIFGDTPVEDGVAPETARYEIRLPPH